MKRVQRFHLEITARRRRQGFSWTNRSTFVLLSCLRVQYQIEQPIGVQVLPTNHGRLHLVELGVNKLDDLVGVTLGSKGRNVVLYGKYGTPKIIKDGVTFAKEVVAAGANPALVTHGIEKTAKALVAEIYL